ncbi:type II toxin-antitoxin system RelE/ParE family toxin [Parabacteroides sp. PF5-6]|uniref:type II toxin-antitoxin system RelE/ParE family toxin n=1 Tax=Parabacteroides sp. PF5-6 TaxID=1742403 RepID=UPI002405EC09|nr:type II toxin-antitoxin system RelE/ParE family toxin [Parabacteroides sp. PF5-6]MDF9830225.1 toxin ParE1/3/4 [Parabacteroides sp. PF5-6]
MGIYHLTNKAIEDLSDIWNYTFTAWSEKQADRYYEMLIASCKAIANNPFLGKNSEDIFEGLYAFIAGRHILFYRIITENEIEILRILHGSMDLKRQLTS